MDSQPIGYLDDKVDRQNIFNFSRHKQLVLWFCLKPQQKQKLARHLDNNETCMAHFVDNVEDMTGRAALKSPDAIVVDITGGSEEDYRNLAKTCEQTKPVPVIAIGDSYEEESACLAFDAGVEDLVALEEAKPRHLLRVIGYAVIRNRNLLKASAFELRHSGIIENATEGIFQTTPKGRYILANPALATLYGFATPEDMMSGLVDIGTQLYVDSSRRTEFTRLMLENDAVFNFESRIRRKDGSEIWISENARAVRDEQGDILYYEGFVRNISERKRNEEQLRYLAQRDPLTGLPNRNLFQERLAEAIQTADANSTKVGILFVDLDNFKTINDTMGHPVGDVVLQKVAERLVSSTSAVDTVARLGGDEFAIVLPDIRSPEIVARVASRILDTLSTPIEMTQRQIYTSGSIGISIYPTNGSSIAELMQNVDTAAYHAKNIGRNRYQFYSEVLSTQALRRLEIENGLRQGLEKKEFSLCYQPKVDLSNRQIIGAEALLRWENDSLGSVRPDEFIPIAEDMGLIIPIGEWVINEVCRTAMAWLNEGLNPGCIALNVSARQFRNKNLYDDITRALETSGLLPGHLELELTESALVDHIDETVELLNKFGKLGIRISIDDFGTGYSSLSYLKRFPLSTLKIDRSFIIGLPEDQEDVAITKAIINLSHSLDLKVVAEGIETPSQSAFLKALNCEYGQGYLFAKPLTASEFRNRLISGI